jgi:hypothetical protein
MLGIDLTVFVQLVGFGVFLWIGLYLLLQSSAQSPLLIVSAIGMFAQSIYFATEALAASTSDLAFFLLLAHGFWWTKVLPAATWYHVSCLIAQRPLRISMPGSLRLILPRRVVMIYSLAFCLILVGSLNDLIVFYSEPQSIADGFTLSSGIGYPAFILYLIVAAVGALFNLLQALRRIAASPSSSREIALSQLRLLIGGGVFFLLGALWLSLRRYTGLPISDLPGLLCLVAGLMALAYSVVSFGMLLEGQDIKRDFLYSLTLVALLNLIYVVLVNLFSVLTISGVLTLVMLVTLTHTTFDSARALLDRLFFNRDEQAARAEARDYATALAAHPVQPPEVQPSEMPEPADTQPDDSTFASEEPESPVLTDQKRFKDAVRRAISGLKSPPRLAQSPLLALPIVAQRVQQANLPDNRLNRVAALRELLIEQIDGLRPSDDDSSTVGDSWRFYNVLYYPYVRELSRKAALAEARRLAEERRRNGQREASDFEQVLNWLADVDEDTFYKWQRRASDTIASIIWEENQKLSA